MSARIRAAIATGLVLVALTFMTLQGLLFYRPLPAIDGYFRFLGLDQQAEVVRDVFGIPRIEAATLHDLFFLQGYVTAQDRFAQMEEMREQATSTFGSLPAPLDPATIAALDAYADGVTKYIEQHGEARALPAEISLSGRKPRVWTAGDSLAILERHIRASTGTPCLVIDAEKARRGRPLLAAELTADMPGPGWYEVGVIGPGIRAIGLSIPGTPGLVAGHNGLVAWSLQVAVDRPSVTVTALRLVAALGVRTVEELTGPTVGSGSRIGCAADISGGLNGTPMNVADADVELLRLTLGPTRPAEGAARIVVDLGDLDASRSALSTGQSGHPVAFHYRDQAQLWSAGMLHRLGWTPGAIARMEGRLVLRPR